MTVVGICTMKNELDVAETTVRHMLGECDAVCVADNGSTDGTREMLKALAEQMVTRLDVRDDFEPGHYHGRKMTALAAHAHALFDADWIVPFDADEIWVARDRSWGTIAQVLSALPASESTAPATLWDHRATGRDGTAGSPQQTMVWREPKPLGLPKVAARAVMPVIIEEGNHAAGYGMPTPSRVLAVHHFPYRSAEQMIRKVRQGAAAYRKTDSPEDWGAHWRAYDTFDDDGIADIFRRHFYRDDPLGQNLAGDDPLVRDEVRLSDPRMAQQL